MDLPHSIVVNIQVKTYVDMIDWLSDRGHVFKESVAFGFMETQGFLIIQTVQFACKTEAILFKLEWDGK